MLASWQQLQKDVWQLEAELQHSVGPAKESIAELAAQRQYHALLTHAFRHLQRAYGGPDAETTATSTSFRGNESNSSGRQQNVAATGMQRADEVLGAEAARAWCTYFRAAMKAPGQLPILAREAGWRSYEPLSRLASSWIEDPLVGLHGPGGGKRLVQALDDLFASEIGVIFPNLHNGEGLSVQKLLADGTFTATLLQVLTQQSTSCTAWAQSVLLGDVMDAVTDLTRSKASSSSAGATKKAEASPSASPIESCPSAHRAAAPPDIAVASVDFSSRGGGVKLRHAATSMISALCERADTVPTWFCHVAASICRQLGRHLRVEEEAAKAKDELLGSIILNHWLVPALLQQFGHSSKSSLSWETEDHAHMALISFTKLLKMIASQGAASRRLPTGNGITGESGPQMLNPVAAAALQEQDFVSVEAQRLQLGFFKTLLDRSHADQAASSPLGAPADAQETPTPDAEGTQGPVDTQWPCCLVWSVGDLSALGSVLSATPHVLAAEAAGLAPDTVFQLDMRFRQPVNPSTLVVLWLHPGTVPSPVARGVFQPPPRSEAEARDAPVLDYGERGALEREVVLELVWQVLAVPKMLAGASEAGLAGALKGRSLSSVNRPLQQQLRVDMLLQWMRHQQPPIPGFGRSSNPEAALLRDCTRLVEQRRSDLMMAQRSLGQLQVAQRTLEQECDESLQALRIAANCATEARCTASLRSLWKQPSSNGTPKAAPGGGPGGLLTFCMLSPPKTMSPAMSAKASLNSSDSRRLVNTQSNGPMPMQLRVQLFEVPQCPCCRVASVGATMGLETQLERTVKHRTFRSLSRAALGFCQLPLESVLELGDPWGIAPAIHALLEKIAARLVAACRQQELLPNLVGTQGFPVVECAVNAGSSRRSSLRWTGLEEISRINEAYIWQYASQFLFSHLHLKLFPSSPSVEDRRVAECMARLAWIQARHLGIPEVHVDTPQLDAAVTTLRRLHVLGTPGDMLRGLFLAFRHATEAASLRAGLCGSTDFGADAAVPLSILLVLRANPPKFKSVLEYAEIFATRSQMLTEQGYALTQANGAISFAESVQPRSLQSLQPGEWERHMGTDSGGGG